MRIVGIDVGTTSVKAVELESAFGRFEIHEYYEQRIAAGADPLEAARVLIDSMPKRPDRVAVALKVGQATFRNLQIPSRDRKAILAGVTFELEDDLPFGLENSVFDYSVLSTAGQLSNVHVAATLRRYLEQAVASFQSAGVDPDSIVPETWAYRVFMNRVLTPADQEEPVLLVQIGESRTVLYVHYQGSPIVSREISWGGRDVTTTIARRYGVAEEQAESAKLDHGFVLTEAQLPQATTEQQEFSEAIIASLEALLQEIRQAEFTCKNAVRKGISKIYVSGGTALLQGLTHRIEETLRIPTQGIRALSAITPSGVDYADAADSTFLLASSLALCLVGNERTSGINLRKGEFSKQGRSREFNLSGLKNPLLALAAILACLATSLIVRASSYQKELDSVNGKLEGAVSAFFGQLSPRVARQYLAEPDKLRTRVDAELKKQRDQAKLSGPNAKSPLNFLRDLSATVPRDIKVDLMKFQVGAAPTSSFAQMDDASANLVFYFRDAAAADRVGELLGKKISGLKKSAPQEMTAPDGSKRFKVEFSGKPLEDSYGK